MPCSSDAYVSGDYVVKEKLDHVYIRQYVKKYCIWVPLRPDAMLHVVLDATPNLLPRIHLARLTVEVSTGSGVHRHPHKMRLRSADLKL